MQPPKKSSLSRKEDVSFKVCESVKDPPSFELDRWTLGVSLSLSAKEKHKMPGLCLAFLPQKASSVRGTHI